MKTIIITEGDPCGISYEILDKSHAMIKKFSNTHRFILVKSQKTINSKIKFKNIEYIRDLEYTNIPGLYCYENIIFKSKEEKSLVPGKPSKISGKASYSSLIKGIEIQKITKGNILTLPLSKEWVMKSGISNFTGHTETLAEMYGKNTFMLMQGKKFSVVPMTTHISLLSVPFLLRKFKAKLFALSLIKSKLFKNPRIAVAGLNPHAGENGKIGNEENKILKPMIKIMKNEGLTVDGPISADSLFTDELRNSYDIIMVGYHDQGLIPFKALEGKNGINITLGLDFLRVSPDHGTAFGIANKGIANPDSVKRCIEMLCNI